MSWHVFTLLWPRQSNDLPLKSLLMAQAYAWWTYFQLTVDIIEIYMSTHLLMASNLQNINPRAFISLCTSEWEEEFHWNSLDRWNRNTQFKWHLGGRGWNEFLLWQLSLRVEGYFEFKFGRRGMTVHTINWSKWLFSWVKVNQWTVDKCNCNPLRC